MNRVKFPLPQPQPETPVRGINVRAVVFQSPEMQRLAREARKLRGSKWAVIKPKRASRGILWGGVPFYWTSKGFYRRGTGDRRPLQHLIWEKRHGRPMPPKHEIFFLDRDRHNFLPSNLELLSKAAMHRRIVDIGENLQVTLEQRQQIANKRWERTGRNMTNFLISNFNSGRKTTAAKLKRKP